MASIRERMAAKAAQGSEPPAAGSIRERMATQERIKANLAQTNAQMDALDATDGMSTFQKTAAGIGAGMTDVVQGVGNMVGLVDDEDVAAKKAIDANLADTTAGSVGQMVGEGAALLPLSLIGGGVAAAGAAKLAPQALKYLPRALQGAVPALAGAGTAATLEGAAGGAILANPNERGSGAAKGAATGLVLNKSLAGLSRLGKDGLAKVTPSSTKLMDMVEGKLGKRPHIPMGQAVDITADSSSAKAGAYADFASLLPSAKAKMERQANNLADDVYETNLRQVFGGNKANVAADTFRNSGDMQIAIDAGKRAGKAKVKALTPTQEIVQRAALGSKRGKYEPKHLIRAAEKIGMEEGRDIGDSAMRGVANTMDDVMGRSTGTSNVDARDAYRSVTSTLGVMADKIPKLGEFVASERVQRFLMGNTKWQKSFQSAVASGNGQLVRGTMSDIRRAMSVQSSVQEEFKVEEGEAIIADKTREAADYLRSM